MSRIVVKLRYWSLHRSSLELFYTPSCDSTYNNFPDLLLQPAVPLAAHKVDRLDTVAEVADRHGTVIAQNPVYLCSEELTDHIPYQAVVVEH